MNVHGSNYQYIELNYNFKNQVRKWKFYIAWWYISDRGNTSPSKKVLNY